MQSLEVEQLDFHKVHVGFPPYDLSTPLQKRFSSFSFHPQTHLFPAPPVLCSPCPSHMCCDPKLGQPSLRPTKPCGPVAFCHWPLSFCFVSVFSTKVFLAENFAWECPDCINTEQWYDNFTLFRLQSVNHAGASSWSITNPPKCLFELSRVYQQNIWLLFSPFHVFFVFEKA